MPAEDLGLHLAALKDGLLKNPEFSDTFAYFLDHLGDQEWFHGKTIYHRSKAEKLRTIIRVAVGEFLRENPPRIYEEAYYRVRGTPFYHGKLRAASYHGSVIFFEDINSGLVCLERGIIPGCHIIRITGLEVGTGPIWN